MIDKSSASSQKSHLRKRTILGSAITFIVALNYFSYASEVETALGKLPAPVRKSVHEVAGKGTITKTVRETEPDGTVIYEVAYEVGARKFEAEVSTSGKIIVVDEQITLSKAPKEVQKVIEEKTSGATIHKIEKATKGNEAFYEVEFSKAGKKHELKVAPNGSIIAAE